MKSDDEILDEVIQHLRNETIPDMPKECLEAELVTRATRPYLWYGIAGMVLVASITLLLIWSVNRNSPPAESNAPRIANQPSNNGDRKESKDEIALVPLDLTEPLGRLENELDVIDSEIAELKSKAELLDARRRADELLVNSRSLSLQSVVMGEQE